MGSENRKRKKHIMVRVSIDEWESISAVASQCDMSVPSFLRCLGLGYQPTSTIDHQAVVELANLHGDIGRVGGLLKLWLSNEERVGFANHLNIPDIIAQLKETQKVISTRAGNSLF